jgi:hypothetical protein
LVGARFERENLMEWQHLMVTETQNTPANGYGAEGEGPRRELLQIWATLYGVPYFPSFHEIQGAPEGHFLACGYRREHYLNTKLYERRIELVAEPFLLDANARAFKLKKKAYCTVVGLGLGVWLVHPYQANLMCGVFEKLLRDLPLPHISDLTFSYFPPDLECSPGRNDCVVSFQKRDPAAKLEDPNKVNISMYAWDGNSYPGNEFWF